MEAITSPEALFSIFGINVTLKHLALVAVVAFVARMTTRDRRYLNTYRALLREYKFEFNQEIKIIKIQNQYLTTCFKTLLDEKPEEVKQKIKERFSEIGKTISDFPLEVDRAFTSRTEEPKDPRGLFQYVKDFFDKDKKNGV